MPHPRTMAGHDLGRPTRVLDRGALSGDVRRLSQVSNLRGALAIAREWTLIAGIIAVAVLSTDPLVWVGAGALIATRQHALLILMHDAAHGRLMRGRGLNDAVGDLLLAVLMMYFCWIRILTTSTSPERAASAITFGS